MGATRLTLPSCALTWVRSAVLTNSACRSWVNGSNPVVRFWPAGSSRPTSSPVVSPLRMRDCAARQRDPAAGARAAGVAPDDVADHDPPLSLHRLWACVTPGHQPARRAAHEAVASRAAMGAGRHRVSALDRRSGRRWPRRVVEHREPISPKIPVQRHSSRHRGQYQKFELYSDVKRSAAELPVRVQALAVAAGQLQYGTLERPRPSRSRSLSVRIISPGYWLTCSAAQVPATARAG